MSKKKVFIAEIGNPNAPRSIFSGSSSETVLVIAEDYNQAATKAELYLEELTIKEKKNIFDGDGSLKDMENSELQLLSLRISDTKILW